MKVKVFRPHLDDVERLSYGKGAKKQRGTGSRNVCHRLNRDERKLYEIAKQAGYLTIRGTGYRKERKGSPLCNIYRQRCDALEEICVIVGKRSDFDTLMIDFATLRVADDTPFVSLVLENVFKAKYPDLQWDMESNDDGGERHRQNTSTSNIFSSSIATPIDWEAVKSKPIWGINERIITVTCTRDIAKSLAIDILKESEKFDISTIGVPVLCERQNLNDAMLEITNNCHCRAVLVDEENGDNGEERMGSKKNLYIGKCITMADENDDDSCIDWDDI